MIIKYHYSRNGKVKKGVLVADKVSDTEFSVGFSLARTSRTEKEGYDIFDKEKGLRVAIGRMKSGRVNNVPLSMIEEYDDFVKRAKRYFKDLKLVEVPPEKV